MDKRKEYGYLRAQRQICQRPRCETFAPRYDSIPNRGRISVDNYVQVLVPSLLVLLVFTYELHLLL